MLYNNATSTGQASFISLCAKGSANFLVISPEEQLILDNIPGWQKKTNQDVNVAISDRETAAPNFVTMSTLNSKQTAENVTGIQADVLCSSSTVLQSTLKQNGMCAAKKRKDVSLCEPLSVILPSTNLRHNSEVAFAKKRCTQSRLLSLSFSTHRMKINASKKAALRHFHSMPDLRNLSSYKNGDLNTCQNVDQLLVEWTQNMKNVQESAIKEDFRLKSLHFPFTQPNELGQEKAQKVSAGTFASSAKDYDLKQHKSVDITPSGVSLSTQNKIDGNLQQVTKEISNEVCSYIPENSISDQPFKHSQLLIPVNINSISKRTDLSPVIPHQIIKMDPPTQSTAFTVSSTDSSNSISSSLPCGQAVNEKINASLPFSQKENTYSQQVIPGTPIVIHVTSLKQNEKDTNFKKEVSELNSFNSKPNLKDLISPEKIKNEKLEAHESQPAIAMDINDSPLQIVRKKLFQSLPQPAKSTESLATLPCTSKNKVVAWRKINEHYVEQRRLPNRDCSSLKFPSLVTDTSTDQDTVVVDKKQDFQFTQSQIKRMWGIIYRLYS